MKVVNMHGPDWGNVVDLEGTCVFHLCLGACMYVRIQ